MIGKNEIWPWMKDARDHAKAHPIKEQPLPEIGAEIQASLTDSLRHSHSAETKLAELNAQLDDWWTKPRGKA